ncbi:hypothetical protein CDIK_1112 [Cucumispora dikerogammari]|nr:hypothetical protein CDIK_1112 [Cucumispora dikerogammari]
MIDLKLNDIRNVFAFESNKLYSTTTSQSDDRKKIVKRLLTEKNKHKSDFFELAEEYTFFIKKDFVDKEKLFLNKAKTPVEFFLFVYNSELYKSNKKMTNRHVLKKSKVSEKITLKKIKCVYSNSILYVNT